MFKKIVSEIMLILLLGGVLTFAFNMRPVKATISSYEWIDPVYVGYDSFFGNIVVAYRTGSIAKIAVTVFNDWSITINISVVKLSFDWGIDYLSTEVSLEDPFELPCFQTHTFNVSFIVPPTNIASGTVLHQFEIWVEHVDAQHNIVGSWVIYGYNFAVYPPIYYIRDNGSIDPPTAPISSIDNVTYSLVGDINASIVVERNNIVVDGAGYTVNGIGATYPSKGIDLTYRSNVTIKNIEVKAFYYGVWLSSSLNNSIIGNNIKNNLYGIWLNASSDNNMVENNVIANNYFYGVLLDSSSDNTFSGNNITHSNYGFYLGSSSYNRIYHNNLIGNDDQVYSSSSTNVWDDGYPSGGNYWSDYTGVDVKIGPNQDQPGSDRIGDIPYVIDADNRDRYPLMKPYAWAPHDIRIAGVTASKTIVAQGYNTTVTINVTIINYGEQTETFNFTFQINTTIQEQTITLAKKSFITLTFTWNTTGFAKGNYTISAYAEPVLGETDTEDNTFTGWTMVTIPGDVDGSRKVDMMDVGLCCATYYLKAGDPGYNPNYDIDGNGKIDMMDIGIACAHYYEKET